MHPPCWTGSARWRPHVVYHLAGASDVGGCWDTPQITFRANAEGTLNVLWAAREAGVERVLTVGSADVYGKVTPDELPLTEQSPLRPTSPYAASKVAAESVAEQAFLGYGQQVVRARPFNHLGPGQSTRFVAPALAERIARNELAGESQLAVGNLSSKRDFTDVRDVVKAYRKMMVDGDAGAVYNVCSGEAIAVQDLALALIELSDDRPRARGRPGSPTAGRHPGAAGRTRAGCARRPGGSPRFRSSKRCQTFSTTCGAASRTDPTIDLDCVNGAELGLDSRSRAVSSGTLTRRYAAAIPTARTRADPEWHPVRLPGQIATAP